MLNYQNFSDLCSFLKVTEEKKYKNNMRLEDCCVVVSLSCRYEDVEDMKDLFIEFKETYQSRFIFCSYYENIISFKYRILD